MIKSLEDVPKAYKALKRDANQLMLEEFINFKKEISLIVVAGKRDEKKVYPLGENIHIDNILRTTIVPARVETEVQERAKEIALKIVDIFNSRGVFCIEMFVDQNNDIFVNEIAPRPHNSGHYTIEACSISQFYQHIRAISDLPLGKVRLIKPAVMVNLLGEEGYEGRARLVGLEEILEVPEAHVHFYGKRMTKPQRKMGHVTVLGSTVEEALERVEGVKGTLKVISEEELI